MGSANLEAEVMDFDESEIEVIKIGPFPIIRFSDDLEQKLSKTGNRSITIKLLGMKIDFNTLQLRFFCFEKSIWAKFLIAKYKFLCEYIPTKVTNKQCSNLWHRINP